MARRLALVMRAEVEGRQQIWLRSLDSHDFHALPGTSGSRSPFFSPDGRMLGFFADGKLKVVPVSGGPPRELCDDSGLGGGGTWSRDGVILFGGFTGGRVIGRVNAEGGPCTEVTKSREGGFDIFPSFLPDGDHFVYVSRWGTCDARHLHLLPARSGQRKAPARGFLQPDRRASFLRCAARSPAVSARHHIDGATVQFHNDGAGGGSFPAAVSVSPSSAIPQVAAAMSEDGVLVYLSSPPDSFRLTWIDRAGKELEQVTPASTLRGVALSPDERTVVYSRGQTLFLRDLARGVETPIGEGGRSPLISPDGMRVAFSTGGLVGAGKLTIKEIASGKEETLPMQVSSTFAPSDWSRDGQYLLYTDIHPKTQGDIWALANPVNPRSGQKPMPFLVTNFNESQAQLSPDGRWVAYTSNESGEYAVYVTAFPSGSGKRRVSPAEAREPRWRRDGRELYFLGGSSIGGGRHRMMAVPVEITVDGHFARRGDAAVRVLRQKHRSSGERVSIRSRSGWPTVPAQSLRREQ